MEPCVALILPGLGSSGPQHWQTWFEQRDPRCLRVQQDEWDAPACKDWVRRLGEAVAQQPGPLVLVAHSSSNALVCHWALQAGPAALAKVKAALLVAPSDPDGPNYPKGPTGFSPMPLARLPFRSTVVASSNDPYIDAAIARRYAEAWGSAFVLLEGAGHINTASGHGPWEEGFALLQGLRAG
jgi:uncharacterized protein